MNNQTRPSISQRSPIVRFFRWLSSWRIVRRMLIVLAWGVTLIAFLYGVENWRGRKAWNNYKAKMDARGEVLDLKALIPKHIPDEQNFAATPLIRSWFVLETNAQTGEIKSAFRWNDPFERADTIVPAPHRDDKANRHFTDLAAWQMAFAMNNANPTPKQKIESGELDRPSRAAAAPAVLEALKMHDAMFAELRAASQRPDARYPVVYDLENPWGIMLPHLGKGRELGRRLALKASAELAAGQTEEALQDIKLILRFADSITNEPLLISYLVRVASLQVAIQPVWEGLADRLWSDAQLKELQTHFASYNLIADLELPLDGERSLSVLTPQLIKKKGLGMLVELGEANPNPAAHTFANLAGHFIPSGWFYQEQLNGCRLFDVQMAGSYDSAAKRIFPDRADVGARNLERVIEEGSTWGGAGVIFKHQLLARLMLPALGKVTRKAANAQVAADHVALACALERYRLANKEFPETLAALAPQFISQMPHDVINGEPYKYRRTADGKFILYSVGWNETDDNGMPGKTLFDDKAGDWVWQYSEN